MDPGTASGCDNKRGKLLCDNIMNQYTEPGPGS